MKPVSILIAGMLTISVAISANAETIDITDIVGAGEVDFDVSDITNPDSSFYAGQGTFGDNNVIAEAARGVGIRAGFALEAKRINDRLMTKFRYTLDNYYNFNPLMLQNGYVVPPVISVIQGVKELQSSRRLYSAQYAYEIVREPRITTIPPSWMDYLLLGVREVRPPQGLTFEDSSQKAVWEEASRAGIDEGILEARRAFTTSFATLDRDYRGMQLYHSLAAQGAVSIPQVNIQSQATRIDERTGNRMFVNETVVELVAGSNFRIRK